MHSKAWTFIAAVAALVAAGNAAAGAVLASGTIVVDSTADAASPSECSLRAAVALLNGTGDPGGCVATGAASPPEIRFDLALPATITLSSELSPAASVAIIGPGRDQLALSGGGTNRLFSVTSQDRVLALSRLTLRDGRSPPGFAGGALDACCGHDVVLDDVAVLDSSSEFAGGGLSVSSQLTLRDSLVAGNEASHTTGSFLAFGGGVYLSGFGAQHLIERSRIEGNAVGSTAPGSLPGVGGGLYVRQGISARVVDSTISGNAARGALLRTGFNPDDDGLGGQGGGVFVDGGTLTLLRSAVSDNTASFQGGGLHSYGTVRLANSSVLRNGIDGGDTVDEGGGLFQAADHGMGFDVAMHLVHATVAGNSAARGAGLLVERDTPADTRVDNSVFDNPAGGDIFLSGSGDLSASHSLVAGMTDTGGLVDGVDGNLVGADPILDSSGALHGGSTETLRMAEGSPLIDAGDAALSVVPGGAALDGDQRGLAFVPRVSGIAPDIGAYEYAGGLLFRDGMEPAAP